MHRTRSITAAALVATLAVSAFSLAAGAQDGTSTGAEMAARVNNNPTTTTSGDELLVVENARLTRTEDGIGIEMRLITPEAGSYVYPETVSVESQAQPEVFTGWVFVFNNPDKCTTFPGEQFPCGAQDFNDDVKAGVYNFSGTTNALGQLSGGDVQLNPYTDGQVVLSGGVEVGQTQRPPVGEGTTSHPLENPMGAEVHVAIAPHGQYDAATMPDELFNPVGNPACDCWWVATFQSNA